MADHLGVDTDGLRSAAARSARLADELSSGGTGTGSSSGSQPSHSGVAAVDGAAMSIRDLQSGRVGQQSGGMVTGSKSFDGTESRSAADIARSM
ncbi:hypothetical protein [Mycobacteroides salmoniphilum]|uniref:hypothetical protein n=1 Tax=Mycobacteroides salmoniphilum TaxID=404941 RepID=UPI0009941D45|nr:hypothetical protein [Mycobacteroides salmoniphilum]